MTGEGWWIVVAIVSCAVLVATASAALVQARVRQQRVEATEQDRDHWRRVADERGAEADRLARESARLTEERAELLARLREAEDGPRHAQPIDRDVSALHDRVRVLAPAADVESVDGPRGPVTIVTVVTAPGVGPVRALRSVPQAVEQARERGLVVQPSDQGHRFAIAASTDALLGGLASALLDDASERLGRGAQVQLALHWEAPAVVVRLTPY